jgi:hypothetical protein
MPSTPVVTTFTRFDAIGVREDLSDEIHDISPTDTPFLTNAGRGKADQTLFEWQTDALAAAVTTNQQIEGYDLTTYAAVTPTVRQGNYCEIAEKDFLMSGTLEATKRAGRGSEIARETAKKLKEIKRDMESSLLANKGASAGSTAAARVTGSLLAFTKTNVDKDSGTTKPVYTSIPTDVWSFGSTRAFTETIVKNVVQQGYTSGADFGTIMVGAWNKQVFSGFSGVVELTAAQQKASQATIIGAASTYVSDFGNLQVMPNRFQNQSVAHFIDWNYVKVNYLRPVAIEKMAKTGDAEKRMINVEYGLEVGNEKALGVATDLATS